MHRTDTLLQQQKTEMTLRNKNLTENSKRKGEKKRQNNIQVQPSPTYHLHHEVHLTLEGLQVALSLDGVQLGHATQEVAAVGEDEGANHPYKGVQVGHHHHSHQHSQRDEQRVHQVPVVRPAAEEEEDG